MTPSLHLPAHLAAAITAAATAADPNEACGILLGHATPTIITVIAALPTANLSPTPLNHYMIDPRALLAAERAASPARHIVGFYHSHPTAPPIPSKRDLAEAWELYAYLIFSVPTQTLRVWQIPSAALPFRELHLATL